VSAAPAVAVVVSGQPDSWRAALQRALRPEFLATPLVLPAGSSLAPPQCAVPDCPRVGDTTPWGRFDVRLCGVHKQRWITDGKPAGKEWLTAQRPPTILRPIERCAAAACARSVQEAGLCGAHKAQWVQAGRPPLARLPRWRGRWRGGMSVAGSMTVSFRAWLAVGRGCATRT